VVALRIRAQERNGVFGPVGREDVRASKRGRERRQPEPCAELDDPLAVDIDCIDDARESDAARPQLGPVGQELVCVERRLVDQLVRARRPQKRQRLPGELELLLDQSGAYRSTPTPFGSSRCA
jgi:hypothetical protein